MVPSKKLTLVNGMFSLRKKGKEKEKWVKIETTFNLFGRRENERKVHKK